MIVNYSFLFFLERNVSAKLKAVEEIDFEKKSHKISKTFLLKFMYSFKRKV